ncbi:MAG: hypothetical protein Q8J62_01540 [Candidatus Cloacimonadaceae bacterium]|nr:hypothetical protein [Candidatus Cloacimonadaceae bacterium]
MNSLVRKKHDAFNKTSESIRLGEFCKSELFESERYVFMEIG